MQEKDEYVEQIIVDIGRLGLQYEKITYTSDYFPQARGLLTSLHYSTAASICLYIGVLRREP